jgi:hypothetical protein
VTWTWTQVDGARVSLVGDGATVTFVAPARTGPLVFGLSVFDGLMRSAEDRVTVECHNLPPVADAGPDSAIVPEQIVQLDASGTVDADAFEVVWRQTQGPTVQLSDATGMRPTFVAPNEETQLEFQLDVVDAELASATDSIRLTASWDRTVTVDTELGRVGTHTVAGGLPRSSTRSVHGALVAGTRDNRLEIWRVEADAVPRLLTEVPSCNAQGTAIDAAWVVVVCNSARPDRVRLQLFRHTGGGEELEMLDELVGAFHGRPALVRGDVAVALGEDEVAIYGTRGFALREVGRIDTEATLLVAGGRLLFVVRNLRSEVAVYDLRTPAAPEALGAREVPALDLAVGDGEVWTVGSVDGTVQLARLAISPNGVLDEVERHELPWAPAEASTIAVDEHYVYLGSARTVSMVRPTAPWRRVRGFAPLEYPLDSARVLTVPGGVLTATGVMTVSGYDTGLRDVAVPSTRLATLWSPDVLLVERRGDLHILDVSDPDEPREISFWEGTPWQISEVHRQGDVAVVISNDRLHTVDLSDLAQPRLLASLEAATNNGGVSYFHDGRVYLPGSGTVVDVRAPSDPELLAVHPELIGAHHLEHEAVVQVGPELVFYDLADPQSPVVLRTVPVEESRTLLGWVAGALVIGSESRESVDISCADPETGVVRSRIAVAREHQAVWRATGYTGPARVDALYGTQWLEVPAAGVCELRGAQMDSTLRAYTNEVDGRVASLWSDLEVRVWATIAPRGLRGAAAGNHGQVAPGDLASWTVTGTPSAMRVRCHATGGECAVRVGDDATIVTWTAPAEEGSQHEVAITVGDARIFEVLSRDRVYVAAAP